MLLGESDQHVIVATLRGFDRRLTSRLLAVELRRLALREGLVEDAERLLEGTSLIPLDDEILNAAEGLHPANVATLDAIHLATALRLAADGAIDALMTYDRRLAEGARFHGLTVLAPE